MRKFLVSVFTFCALFQFAYTQDFSNKGKDFWVGYGWHQRMSSGGNSGGSQDMVLYFTSDVNANVKIEIPSVGYVQNLTVPANTVQTSTPIPKSGMQDARLFNEGKSNRGIHITSDRPVVAYAHIYSQNVSGATLLFPTNTLGKEYYSVNFTQTSNEGNSNSWFFVVATEDNTLVEIIPSAATVGGLQPGVPFTVSLNKGEVYNVKGTISGNSGVDLTGSSIRSISSATGGCKRIAVFSGTGKINIGCGGGSADNFIQQVFPKNAWGKKYLTAPTSVLPNNVFRVVVSDPSTIVKINGIFQTGIIAGRYYEFQSNTPSLIEADQPIMVAQYISSQGCMGNGSPGDPEMIYLSPIEQTINTITLNSTPNYLITNHYINVIMKMSGVGSITLDGVNVMGNFQTHPLDPAYVYASLRVNAGQHTLKADSGFNAIAYGLGDAESYGYNAGTSIKDLYQYVSISNDLATVNFPAGCKSSPLKFAMTFPYKPLEIKWVFGPILNLMGLMDTTITNPVEDSSWVVDGRTLYRYNLQKSYTIINSGTYPISVVVNNPTPDGCGGEQVIDYDLQIFDPPAASFTVTHNGCISDDVVFTDNTNGLGRTIIKWNWDFGDGSKGTVKDPLHKYNASGSYTVKHSVITDIGCISDTASKIVPISDPPVANFSVSSPACAKANVVLSDLSTVSGGGVLAKWKWDFGDGTIINATNGNPVQHIYNTPGNYVVSLVVETSSGCKSFVYSKTVVVNAKPTVDFTLPGNICLPAGTGQFTDISTITDGTQNLFTYLWNFGDGQTSTQKSPSHQYTAIGPYNVQLKVTSSNGCIDSSTKILNTIYPQAKADFTVTPEVCLGIATQFTDKSDGKGSNVVKWNWDFGNGQTSTQQNTTHTYTTAGSYKVRLHVFTDKGCVSDTSEQNTTINPLPTTAFTFSAPTCETQNVGFSDASTVATGSVVKWNWNFGDGSSSAQQNPTHIYTTPNTYNVSLDVESDKGCKNSVLIKPVKVNYLPLPDFGTPKVCLADPFVQFTDSSTIADNSASLFTYLWDFGDPNASAGNPNTSTQKNPQHKYSAARDYDIKLTVTSKDGCVRDTIKKFTVNGVIPVASFTVNNSSMLCSNDDVTVVDASTVADFGKIVKLEIYWDYTNDPTQKTIDSFPAAGKVYKFKYADFGTPLTKTYQIRYVVYSGINCVNQLTKTITVNASPEIQFASMNAVCENISSFQITEANEIYGLAGTGNYTGTGVSAGGMFNPLVARPGLHTIRYSFVAANGCSTYKDQQIRVNPKPTVDAGPDRVVLEGGYVVLQGKGTGNNVNFLWSPNVSIDNVKIAMPKVSPATDITYQLLVTSVDGCKDSNDVFVKVLKEPKVPNAFSPNGDGIHDKWVIEFLDTYPGATVEVYNRYGQIVFSSIGYSKPWDGTVNGNPLPVATYYWIINPKNGRKQMNGSVTILR